MVQPHNWKTWCCRKEWDRPECAKCADREQSQDVSLYCRSCVFHKGRRKRILRHRIFLRRSLRSWWSWLFRNWGSGVPEFLFTVCCLQILKVCVDITCVIGNTNWNRTKVLTYSTPSPSNDGPLSPGPASLRCLLCWLRSQHALCLCLPWACYPEMLRTSAHSCVSSSLCGEQ